MREAIEVAAAALAGFLSGSVPFAYILVKLVKGIDVRSVGSGNVGATNAARALGFWAFPTVLLLDAAKGFVPTLLFLKFFGIYAGIASAAGAFLGHVFTPWLGFRGGKGVAVGLGSFLALSPLGVGAGFLTWLVVVLITRYVSLGSILGAFATFLWITFVQGNLPLSIFSGLGALGVWFTHRENVKRLLAGTERKFTFSKKKDK